MINGYAPVLIPTLNRFDHFERCVASLSACEGSEQTDLFVALDYPSKESHWEGFTIIKELLKDIKGFKSLTVINRTVNFGAHANIHEAYDFIFKNYDRVILSEDDNVFSKDFLIFINKSLQQYEHDSTIFSVSGYNYPVKMPKSYTDEVYFWRGYSAWGVGLWRDKFLKMDCSEEAIQNSVSNFFKDYKKVWEFNKIANNYVPALVTMLEKKAIHGDTYICLYQFLNNMTSVFPVVSRVRNLGHDGSGVNCGVMIDDIYSKQEIYQGKSTYEIPKNAKQDEEINTVLRSHFSIKMKSQFKFFCKLFLINKGFHPQKA